MNYVHRNGLKVMLKYSKSVYVMFIIDILNQSTVKSLLGQGQNFRQVLNN